MSRLLAFYALSVIAFHLSAQQVNFAIKEFRFKQKSNNTISYYDNFSNWEKKFGSIVMTDEKFVIKTEFIPPFTANKSGEQIQFYTIIKPGEQIIDVDGNMQVIYTCKNITSGTCYISMIYQNFGNPNILRIVQENMVTEYKYDEEAQKDEGKSLKYEQQSRQAEIETQKRQEQTAQQQLEEQKSEKKLRDEQTISNNNSMVSKSYGGGLTSINSKMYNLHGRVAKYLPKPKFPGDEGGIVVVEISVDKFGKVISVKSGIDGTTATNPALLEAAAEAASKAVFNEDIDAADFQKGSITYQFVLQ